MDRSVQYYFIDICKSKNKIDFKMIITLQKNTILHLNADWMTGYIQLKNYVVKSMCVDNYFLISNIVDITKICIL